MFEYVTVDYAEGLIYKEGVEEERHRSRGVEHRGREGWRREEEGVVDLMAGGRARKGRATQPLRLSYATRALLKCRHPHSTIQDSR